MSDKLKWCDACGDRSEGNCGNEQCPMTNFVVDTGDELHQILGEALRRALSHKSAPTFKATQNSAESDLSVTADWAGADTALSPSERETP